MAINQFKSFATAAGANVTSQGEYEVLPALDSGFRSGKASSAQVNKVLRQASTVAAMLGEFISDAGFDALDDGGLETLLTSFTEALGVNLQLGTASKRNIGVAAGNIPDMSSFSYTAGSVYRLPSGLIIQMGQLNLPDGVTSGTGAYPVAFPNTCSTMAGSGQSASGFNSGYFTFNRTLSKSNFAWARFSSTEGTAASFIALGY